MNFHHILALGRNISSAPSHSVIILRPYPCVLQWKPHQLSRLSLQLFYFRLLSFSLWPSPFLISLSHSLYGYPLPFFYTRTFWKTRLPPRVCVVGLPLGLYGNRSIKSPSAGATPSFSPDLFYDFLISLFTSFARKEKNLRQTLSSSLYKLKSSGLTRS